MKKIHKIQQFMFQGILKATMIIPKKTLYKICLLFGKIYYFIDKNRRNITLKNLSIVYPNKNKLFKKKLSKNIYQHYSLIIADLLLIVTKRLSDKELNQLTDIHGMEHLQNAINSNRGILVITGHFGCWELIPRILSMITNKKINIIARKSKNIVFEDLFIKKLRQNTNVNVVFKDNSLMSFVRGFKNKEINGILIDQNQKNNQGTLISFFKKEAFTTLTPALLQIKYNPVCLPIFMIKSKNNKFKFIINNPIEVNYNLSDKNLINLTLKHQKELEDIILKYPEQWLWMHNRWNI